MHLNKYPTFHIQLSYKLPEPVLVFPVLKVYSKEFFEDISKVLTTRLLKLQPPTWLDAWSSDGCIEYAGSYYLLPNVIYISSVYLFTKADYNQLSNVVIASFYVNLTNSFTSNKLIKNLYGQNKHRELFCLITLFLDMGLLLFACLLTDISAFE